MKNVTTDNRSTLLDCLTMGLRILAKKLLDEQKKF